MDDTAVILNMFKGSDKLLHIAPEQPIFRRGDPGDALFVLKSGNAEIRIGDRTVEVITPGDIVGEMSLIDGNPRSGDAIATTPCQVVRIDIDEFLLLIRDEPFFALYVMRTLTRRLRQMDALARQPAPQPRQAPSPSPAMQNTLPLDLMAIYSVWTDLTVQAREDILRIVQREKPGSV
jgi:CRP-like cAMP-binding protein